MDTTLPIHGFGSTGAHLSITVEELVQLRLVALGTQPPTLIIRGGTILALHTGELLERDVIVNGRHIAAITPWNHFPATKNEIDATGRFVSPSFIDTHLHIEYTKLVPGELARLSVPRGTTTVLADANCIANVFGGRGMDFMGETSTPLRIFRQVSHKIPGNSPEIELGGTSVSTAELCERVSQSAAATLGESNPFSLDLGSAQKQAAALRAGKRITGHSALLMNEPLWAYAAGGIGDDHNAHQPHDVIERLRLGMMLTVMSGSMNSNIESVFSNISLLKDGLGHISFCADDKLAEDLDAEGHIDHHVRTAIKLGVDPVAAYKMATLNAACYYHLDALIGSITPAKLADLLILDNLCSIIQTKFQASHFTVYISIRSSGTHRPSVLNPRREGEHGYKQWRCTMSILSGLSTLLPVSSSGSIEGDISRDVLKVVVIDRHHGTKNCGIGFVRGFGLQRGAIACTTNCENQNLVIAGTSDEEIAGAVKAIDGLGGGFAAVLDGKLLGSVRLDVAGCMSSENWEKVRDDSIACDKAATALGCTIKSPFMIMSFVGLVAVPDLGLTELGLVDCKTQGLMDVVLQDGPEVDMSVDINKYAASSIRCRCPSHAHDIHKMMDATVA